jgi:hydrogenase maturation protease
MIIVIGLGNFLRGDDAIGPLVIEKLKEFNNTADFKLLNAGMDAFSVLDYLMGSHPVIIIDCAKMGKKPGEVVEFNVNDGNITRVSEKFSLHGIGFADIYKIAAALGTPAPCKIIAVEPKQLNFNAPLSSMIESSIPEIIKLVMMEAKSYA